MLTAGSHANKRREPGQAGNGAAISVSFSDPEEYIAKATTLAHKPEALAKIRSSMRARMAASPVCNRALFARNIEQAYRRMWYKWCKSKGVDVPNEELRPDAQRLSAEAAACSSKSAQATTNPLGET